MHMIRLASHCAGPVMCPGGGWRNRRPRHHQAIPGKVWSGFPPGNCV